MYILQTYANHPNAWLSIYPQNKLVSMFFVAYSFWTVYVVVNIVVSIVYIIYKKHYADIIAALPNKDDYSRILAACYDEKSQVVVLDDVRRLTKQYLNDGPQHLNFIMAKHFQIRHMKNELDPIPDPNKKRDTGCNLKLLISRQSETPKHFHDDL